MVTKKESVPAFRVAEVTTATEPTLVTDGDEPKSVLEVLAVIANDVKELKKELVDK